MIIDYNCAFLVIEKFQAQNSQEQLLSIDIGREFTIDQIDKANADVNGRDRVD